MNETGESAESGYGGVNNPRPWQAVEVGADEWFLGKPDGDNPATAGWDPFWDFGDVPKDLAHRIAACLNACRGVPTDELTNWSKMMNEYKLPYASIAYCKELLKLSGYVVTEAPKEENTDVQ